MLAQVVLIADAGSRGGRGHRDSTDSCVKGGKLEAPYNSVCLLPSGLRHELPVLLHWSHGTQVQHGHCMTIISIA